MRKHTVIHPTAEQLSALTHVRTQLAERGYLIAPVAACHRRHESDFVAVLKTAPRQFAIVRVAETCIIIRPFREKRGELYRIIPDIRKKSPAHIRRGVPLLKYYQSGLNQWQHYVSEEAHEELAALGCAAR